MNASIGIKNGIIISFFLWAIIFALVFFSHVLLSHAVEKIDDYTFELTVPVRQDLQQYKRLKKSLEDNLTQKQKEIIELERQLESMAEDILDAESKGIKEKKK